LTTIYVHHKPTNTNSYTIKIRQRSARVLLAIALLVLISQVLANDLTPVPLRPRNVPVPEAQKQRIAKKIASGYGMGQFQPSLEMKENVDFLLTPALLVQEAICEDTVITYPTE
jgi:hypothetical protein